MRTPTPTLTLALLAAGASASAATAVSYVRAGKLVDTENGRVLEHVAAVMKGGALVR